MQLNSKHINTVALTFTAVRTPVATTKSTTHNYHLEYYYHLCAFSIKMNVSEFELYGRKKLWTKNNKPDGEKKSTTKNSNKISEKLKKHSSTTNIYVYIARTSTSWFRCSSLWMSFIYYSPSVCMWFGCALRSFSFIPLISCTRLLTFSFFHSFFLLSLGFTLTSTR